ncbi:E3 ubiquitin-protein ligase XIAP-like isoform X2 [Pseudomyrmex gracilis]|uniref:E3 ubiquitin-protein ligase XIAP-like isoform X2 n=1 Tax=Pseudomyrmex gracilis TaxID=219809 RepID=UPI000995BD30|nr:E3 ubiquitin-protein ligase XIAP-like isoform X2 [Pseudomyrmex gracilis]
MMYDMSREMNVEENRLKTFSNWPADDAARLAKAGFYYTGRDRELSCLFAANPTSTCNIPLAPTVNNNVILEATSPSSQLSNGQSNGPSNGQSNGPSNGQPSDASTNNTEIFRRPLNPRREYGTVQQRLESFTNWPIPSIVLPEKLASAGFYYLQYKDMVECAFCGGVIANWEPNQDLDMLHRSYFPNCDFYMNRDEDDILELVTVLPGTKENITDLGIQRHMTPANPRYAVYEKRLQTFTGWPKDLTQTPEMLAAAGFYYTGCRDQVRCFHCDGGLRDWEPTDDVWVEHARWFAKCGFVNLMRGQKFVQQCIDNRKPLDLSIFATKMPVDETGILRESPTTLQTNMCPMTHDTATFDQDVEISILSLATAVQDRNPVTDTKKSAKDVAGTSVASLTTLASNELSKSAILERVLEDTNLDSDMTEAELRLLMALVKKLKRFLKKRLEETGESSADIDQPMRNVLRLVEDDTRDKSNSPTSELINLLKECTVTTPNNAANDLNAQEASNATKDKLEKKKADDRSDDIMSLREENRKLKEAHLCKVCMDHELALVFLPCGHLTTCDLCGPALTNCPLCRLEIRAYVRTYLS